ncbi:MAG: hypothetical protein RL095_809 [Verrucomicrobiota bacterium]|jgi:hypothetical protein
MPMRGFCFLGAPAASRPEVFGFNDEVYIMNFQAHTRDNTLEVVLLVLNLFVVLCADSFVVSLYEHGLPPCGNDGAYLIAGYLPLFFFFTIYSSIHQLNRCFLYYKSKKLSFLTFLIILNIVVIILSNTQLFIGGLLMVIMFSFCTPLLVVSLIITSLVVGTFIVNKKVFEIIKLDLRFSWSRIGISVLIGFLLFVLLYPYRGT